MKKSIIFCKFVEGEAELNLPKDFGSIAQSAVKQAIWEASWKKSGWVVCSYEQATHFCRGFALGINKTVDHDKQPIDQLAALVDQDPEVLDFRDTENLRRNFSPRGRYASIRDVIAER
jgi:hypothetical protein